MTPAVLRSFFAIDAEIGRTLDRYFRRRKSSKEAIAAAGVWRAHADFACICAAEKADGREVEVYVRKRKVRRG